MPYKDRELQRAYQRKIHQEVKAALNEIKEATPCMDCGNYYKHYQMDFDHVPERGRKSFNVGTIGTARLTNQRLKDEIAKCDLVCKNCHGTRTWFRNQEP